VTLLTANDVADKLNVSLSTISKLVASGHLRGYRIGRCLRISDEALDEYLMGVVTECHSKDDAAPTSGKSGSKCEASASASPRAQRLAERLRRKSESSGPTTSEPFPRDPKDE